MSRITPTKLLAHLDRAAAWQRGEKAAPVTVEWDLSNRCTLGCQSCHFAHTHVRGPWVSLERRLPMAYDSGGDLANVSLVQRVVRELAESGVQGVIWTGGGEPTTHPHWVACVEAAAEAGLQQGMYTLGGLLTADSARFLANRLTWVVVSLDCADGESYAREKGVPASRFEAARQGVRWLTEAGTTTVGVSFLVHAENWQRLPEMLTLARSLGATYTTFRPTIDTAPDDPATPLGDRDWITKALPLLEQMADEPDVECDPPRFAEYLQWQGRNYDTCYGIRFNTTITPDGRVWVCPQRRGIPGSEIGDLRTESFAAIWARHPGQWTDFRECRVMCRLHLLNGVAAEMFAPYQHEAFV